MDVNIYTCNRRYVQILFTDLCSHVNVDGTLSNFQMVWIMTDWGGGGGGEWGNIYIYMYMICFHFVVADPIYACQSIASLLFGGSCLFRILFFFQILFCCWFFGSSFVHYWPSHVWSRAVVLGHILFSVLSGTAPLPLKADFCLMLNNHRTCPASSISPLLASQSQMHPGGIQGARNVMIVLIIRCTSCFDHQVVTFRSSVDIMFWSSGGHHVLIIRWSRFDHQWTSCFDHQVDIMFWLSCGHHLRNIDTIILIMG